MASSAAPSLPQQTITTNERLFAPKSPDSASSTSNNLWSLAQDTPRVIRIPYRMLLNLMLQDLGLSKAEYHFELCENSGVRMTVLFNTAPLSLDGATIYTRISGTQSTNYEVAEDSACENAIAYIEMATNPVIRDFSYNRLREVQETYESLVQYKKQLERGWFLAVRHMASFYQQMLSIMYLNHSKEEGPVHSIWNKLLVNFQDMAFRLKHAGKVLENRLNKIRNDSSF